MSAGIEQHEDGRATFVAVKEHGWHQLGTLSDKELTVTEALSLAHLADLDYHLEPLAVPVGEPPRFISGGDYRASVRRNPFTGEWEVLGAGMTSAYTMHTPEVAFAFGENLIDAGKPLAALGSIDGGRKAFAAFAADDLMIGGVDQIKTFLNIMTSFDASQATYCRFSAIRVVCANTYGAVMSQDSAPTYVVRHVGEPLEGRIEDARSALDIGYRGMEAFQKEAEALLDRDITEAQFDSIVKALLPIKDDAPDVTITRQNDNRAHVHRLYDGPTVATVRGTAWGALNAWTEWADWTSGQFRSDDARTVARITPKSVIDAKRIFGAKVIGKAVGLAPVSV